MHAYMADLDPQQTTPGATAMHACVHGMHVHATRIYNIIIKLHIYLYARAYEAMDQRSDYIDG